MPRLPSEEDLGARPVPRGSRGVAKYQPAAIGRATAAIGADMFQAGQIIQQTNEKHDTIAAEDAYNKLQMEQDSLANDPDDGFLNKKGENAVGQKFYDDEMTRFNQAADSIEAGLKNDNQRELAKRRRDIAERNHKSKLLKHQSNETNAFSHATEESTIATENRNISNSPLDDNIFASSMARIDATIKARGDRLGVPVEEFRAAAVEDAWEGRILSLVDDNPATAKELYKKSKQHMTKETKNKIEGLLEESTMLQVSQQKTDEIIASGKDNTSMLEDARKISDPEERKEVVGMIKARITETEKLESIAQNEAASQGYELASQGQKIPTTLYAEMDGKTQMALRKLEINGTPDKDDLEIYYAIKKLPPEQFAQEDLLKYSPYLKTETLKSFINEQSKVADGDFTVIGDMAKINSSIEVMKIDKKDKGAMYSKVDAWAQSLGHKPTGEELQGFLDGLQREVLTDEGYLWDTRTAIGKIKVDGVPDKHIPAIVESLDKRGIEASDENVMKMYQKAVESGGI